MERILSAEQMRTADKFTIEKLGVPEDALVERAGNAVAEVIKRRFKGGRVLVCIGKGNNGADGKVVADVLSKVHGFSVATLNVGTAMLRMFDRKFDIIVDCIFGTGLNKEVNGVNKTVIEKINSHGAFVVSCDIPSGLNSNNGIVMGVAVKANLTVAIQEYKLGHFLNDGPDFTGEIVCKDIGISVWEEDCAKRISPFTVAKFFSNRKRNTHKGCFGSACVIGGSKEYTGSIILSSNALSSLKMGVGYSALAVPKSMFNTYVGKVPECLLYPFNDVDNSLMLEEENVSKILSFNSIAIGMGMTVKNGVYQTIKYLVENYSGNLIIDADGLNSISEFGLEIFKNKKANVIITPHVGEFSRLTGVPKQEILLNSISLAKDFASKHGVIVVLKSSASVITDGHDVYINTTGCSGLAKAGSGDVLSGIIAGITARSEDVFQAVVASCYIFGKAGEKAERNQNAFTITASDVISALPSVINELD